MDNVISRPLDPSLIFLGQLMLVGVSALVLAAFTGIAVLYSIGFSGNSTSRIVWYIILGIGWLVWLFMAGRVVQLF